jgi:hypothetical protein
LLRIKVESYVNKVYNITTGTKNCHTRDLAEYTGLFLRKLAYSSYDMHSKLFLTKFMTGVISAINFITSETVQDTPQ